MNARELNWKIQPGDRFMRLLAKTAGTSKHKIECECVCGNIVHVWGTNLVSGNTQSCGCLKKDRAGEYR